MLTGGRTDRHDDVTERIFTNFRCESAKNKQKRHTQKQEKNQGKCNFPSKDNGKYTSHLNLSSAFQEINE
jgi:hypothetical protein